MAPTTHAQGPDDEAGGGGGCDRDGGGDDDWSCVGGGAAGTEASIGVGVGIAAGPGVGATAEGGLPSVGRGVVEAFGRGVGRTVGARFEVGTFGTSALFTGRVVGGRWGLGVGRGFGFGSVRNTRLQSGQVLDVFLHTQIWTGFQSDGRHGVAAHWDD